MAARADAGAILIGWGITAIGMLTLAFVFQTLANRKPELDSGVYAYAKAGFGDYMGFSSAWGYWISAWLGNVGYFVLLFSTLGYFFPVFGQGNTPIAIGCASVLLWAVHFLVMRGIKEAALINQLTTVAKVVPLIMFIVIAAVAFKADIFTRDIWGDQQSEFRRGDGSGAQHDAGDGVRVHRHRRRQRVLGACGKTQRRRPCHGDRFCRCAGAAGAGQRAVAGDHEPAGAGEPAEPVIGGGAGARIVGPWGALLISIGLAISLLGALLSWALLCAEILFRHGQGQDHAGVPEKGKQANHVPVNALWLTNAMIQIFLLITLFSAGTYTSLIYLASSMILVPYLWSAAYAVLLSGRGETYEHASAERTKDLLIGGIALELCGVAVVRRRGEVSAAVGVAVCAGGDPVRQGQA
jgi:arginine:ornithine antiporter/lysine permease